MPIKLVGILNVTPDSFSDGGLYFDHKKALTQAENLHAEGAEVIDLGGDSSRPGSTCVGEVREWERIGQLVAEVSKFSVTSVDTHFASTARLAIESGASIINDISAGLDPNMLPLIAASESKLVLMHSCCPKPHDFSANASDLDIIQVISEFFDRRISKALAAGIRESQLILDTGMGAFLSPKPEQSLEVLERLIEVFTRFKLPLLIGISRKGFLKRPGELSVQDRDSASAELSVKTISSLPSTALIYLRVHNPSVHKRALGI